MEEVRIARPAHARGPGPGPLPMPLQGIIYAESAHRFTRAQNKALSGSPVGQIVGSMNAVRSVREVVFDIVEEWIAVTEAQAARLTDTLISPSRGLPIP